MSKSNVYFKGVDALKRGLKERATLQDVKDIVKLNGAELTEAAKRNAPVRTGDLRGSISQKITHAGLTSETAPHVNYGAYQEFGTRYILGKFYLKRAFNSQSVKFERDMRKLVK